MPTYIGNDGRIYSNPVGGASPGRTGGIAPPPANPGGHGGTVRPRGREAGFFRKFFFWTAAMGGVYGICHGLGLFLQNMIFADADGEGLVNGIASLLCSGAPTILLVIGFIACVCWGVAVGEDNNFNLLGLFLTVIFTGATCLLGAVILALLPYLGTLLLGFFGLCMLIGVICAIFGG